MKLTKQVKADLAKAYQCAMEISILDMKAPLRYINQYIAENVSGYGTAADEKVQSREEYRKMLMKSRQQSKGMLFKAKIITPYKPKFSDETTAQFHDEIVVQIGDKNKKHSIHLYMSCVFKYQFNKWQMVLFHGSMPDASSTTEDTFHISEAEKKLKELEIVVAQRTADLQMKTRELEIEASLERVRAVTMGMNKPGDILNICKVFFTELQSLGFTDLRNTLINFWDDANGQLHDYDYSDFAGGNFAKLAYSSHPAFEEFQKKIRKAKDAFAKLVINKDGLKSWQQRRRKSGEYKDPRLNKISALYYYFYSTGVGALGISTFSPISKEEVEVLKKFRNVFDMAYQRYVDIQKSEAQSREAQIELALERVRARTMAMQHSEELAETVTIMFEQFKTLGEEPERMAIEIVNEKEQVFEIWATQHGGSQLNLLLKASLDEPHVMQKMYKAWKAKTKSITIDLQGKELDDYFNFLKKAGLPVQRKIFGKRRVQNVATFSKGILTIITPEPRPKETIQLLERFAAVFDGTYTRFLDLQKAEAQARQAKIEAAMEKVRSRAMAMQKPDELVEVAELLRKEMGLLGVEELETSSIYIHHEDIGKTECWYAIKDVQHPEKELVSDYMTIDLNKTFVGKKMLEFYHSGKKQLSVPMRGDARKEWINYCAGHSKVLEGFYGENIPDRTYHLYKFPNGYMGAASPGDISTESWELLQRATTVFSLAYTRFSDLKHAEAQAREAKIEAALERVRSRSLAMHSSGELGEVVTVVLNNLLELGYIIDQGAAAHLAIFSEGTKDFFQWSADPALPHPVRSFIPHTDLPILTEFWDARQKGHDFFANVYSFDEKNTWFNYAFEHSDLKHIPGELKKLLLESETYAHSVAIEKNSAIIINSITGNQLSENQIDILRRFSKVFEQAYTRFLDLQKAEAQAREAEIELALERVRAAAMAMRDSAEIGEIIYRLYVELTKLDTKLDRCFIMIVNPENHGITWWMSGKEGLLAENGFFVQMNQHPTHLMYLECWRKRTKKWQYLFEGKEKRDWDRFGFSKTELVKLPEFVKDYMTSVKKIHLSGSSDQFGSLVTGSPEPLPDEQQNIISRFTIAFNQTYTRFLDLQKAEAQAREAQIEAALERVRSRTMAMQRSDELLEVASILFQQVKALGVPQWNCGFNIWNTGDKEFTYYPGSPDGVILPSPCKIPLMEHPVFMRFDESRKKGRDLLVYEKKGEEQEDHYRYMLSLPGVGDLLRSMMDAGFTLPAFQIDHVANFSYGNLIFITYEHFPEMHDVFKRFAKVFEQTYTRFLDLQKAETQGREAEIELALERVRARTMAMQHSNELPDAATILFQQVQSLGMPAWSAGYCIWNEDQSAITLWMSSEGVLQPPFTAPTTEDELFIEMRKGQDEGKTFHVVEMGGDKLVKHYQYMRTLPMMGDILDSIIAAGHPLPTFQIMHHAYFSKGFLLFITYEPVPEAHDIFKRFGKVFDQTYTRFLDLQKAEAQAKEAQIETALEKVRSRSLAMHKSDELQEVVNTLFERLMDLDIEADSSNIAIFKEGTRDYDYWIASNFQKRAASFHMAYIDMSLTKDVVAARERGEDFSCKAYSFEEKNEWFNYAFKNTDFKHLTEERKQYILDAKAISVAIAYSKNTGIQINRYSGNLPSEGEIDILKRFAKVFEQAYIRFLDLQKAEAQAREAQIEAALERVRARAMAMHTSQELQEVAMELRQQMGLLGQKYLEVCAIHLYEQEQDFFESLGAMRPPGSEDKIFQGTARFPKSGSKIIEEMMQLYASGQGDYVLVNEKEKAVEWFGVLKQYAPEAYAALIHSLQGVTVEELIAYWSLSDFSGGSLLMVTHTYPDESSRNLLRRAANVFDLAYRRFSDLKKAEAQAREAQIEAALERVRSRSMAMHKSDELLEAGEILFLEMQKLGIESLTAGYVLIDKEEKNGLNYTPHPGTKKIMPVPVIIPHNETSQMQQVVENWKKGNPSFIVEMDEEETIQHQTFIAERSTNFPLTAEQLIAISPTRLFLHNFYFKEGYILIVGGTKLSEEQTDIMLRFAKVFQQTYTRFLDLQKAEAQGREAEIELALERVRARTMAMQKSTDLGETSALLFGQLNVLVPELWTCGFVLCDINKTADEWWLSGGSGFMPDLILPNVGDALHNNIYKAWLNGESYYEEVITGEALRQHYDWLMTIPSARAAFDAQAAAGIEQPVWQQLSCAYFSRGYLVVITVQPCKEKQIFKRFAQVFEQTYTRFLDLQKAEAQAREAQIETGLERVRSRTMAMHKSSELNEAAELLYQELSKLGIEKLTCGYTLLDEKTGIGTCYMANPDGSFVWEPFRLNHTGSPGFLSMFESWKQQEPFRLLEFSGQANVEHNRYLAEHADNFPMTAEQLLSILPPATFSNSFNFRYGYLLVVSLSSFTKEQIDLMKRFAKVFEQTYTRFLDLQKAEAQTREAQIETALEKVRSRSLAMHKSDEIKEVVKTVVEKIQELNIEMNGGISLVTFDAGSKDMHHWLWIPGQLDDTFKAHLPWFEHIMFHECNGAREQGLELFAKVYSGKEKDTYFDHLFNKTDFKGGPEAVKAWVLEQPYFGFSFAIQKNSGIFLNDYTGKYFSKETNDILVRFSKVFEQAYVRFLDLQKAEAQAREAKIENALEKVRSRSLAMHKSEELQEVVTTVFERLKELDIQTDAINLDVFNENKKDAYLWTAVPGHQYSKEIHIPYNDATIFKDIYEGMISGKEIHSKVYSRELKDEFLNYVFEHTDFRSIPQERKEMLYATDASTVSVAYAKNTAIIVQRYTNNPFSEAENEILKRFAKVFEQCYTRFKDLEKAEAQAKEAQIEVSLERVRARTMAMHNSDDVSTATATMFTELKKLGIENIRGGVTIISPDQMQEVWSITNLEDGKTIRSIGIFDMRLHPFWRELFKVWSNKEQFQHYWLGGNDKEDYIKILNATPNYLSQPIGEIPDVHIQSYFFGEGAVWANSIEPHSDEDKQIMKRFASVFSLTFRRYQDLQKAEAQAREAKIEAALEKVRSSSMAMHKSNELHEVINVVTEQFQQLGFQFDTANFITHYSDRGGDWWISTPGVTTPEKMYFPSTNIRFFNSLSNMMSKEVDFFTESFSFEEKNEFFDFAFENTKLKNLPQERKKYIYNASGIAFSSVISKNIILSVANYQLVPYTEEENAIIKRIGKVFEQSYTRFLDLEKAEAQAKEAQIEAALERVRSKTMAMHNSKDVGESVAALFDELTTLGVLTSLDRCGIGIMQPNEMMELWTADKTTGKTELTIGYLNMQYHTLLKNVYQNWLDKKETYQYILEGNDKLEYYEAMRNQANYKIKKDYYSAYERVVHTDFFFKEGCLFVFSLNEFTTEATSIFIRFVNVFSQTYRRFLDLQKAEAQARESQIEAALERVRSRTLAMQKSDELAETAAEVFRQLISLGIEPNRLYIGIVKEETGDMEMWATDEDGTKVGQKFMFNKNENVSVKKLFDGWKAKEKSVIVDMEGKELEDYFHYLNNVMHIPFKGGLAQKRRVQSVAYFSKGFIGMASPDGQGDDTIQLLERFAAVFNLTFTRFNDLKIAEAHAEQAEQDLIAIKEAKQKAEEALTELQSTQKQLIQSEKMASLGELTAGIAHEIQNPLNFVNNFSEVSTELVDEMNEEIAKGNLEDAAAIASDLKQNLEKINHHGKRAGDIVKGMLQHSRSSSATKEPTDINKLADEYLRLAYHGLRAKDKSFNATLKTAYDESIGNTNIIPQDIGRVILNLFTNAFYVVAEKKRQQPQGYEPTVSVSTKRTADGVEISVKDNGNGIPQKILDKIFQPFFTTKPTGQGTGLGLSLSYDIVKAHDGELKVSTTEGEGSEFIIVLPV